MLEAAIEDAVMFTVLSSSTLPPDLIIDEEDMLSDDDSLEIIQFEKCLARKNVRWWGNELHTRNGNKDESDKGAYSIGNGNGKGHADGRNRRSSSNLDINSIALHLPDSDSPFIVERSSPSAYISGNLPFDCEKSWFEEIESGFDTNDNNYTISCNQDTGKISPKRSPGRKGSTSQILSQSLNSSQKGEMVDVNGDGNPNTTSGKSESNAGEAAQLAIISPETRFNRISGYTSRQQRQSVRMSLSAPQMQSLLDSTNSPPGMYVPIGLCFSRTGTFPSYMLLSYFLLSSLFIPSILFVYLFTILSPCCLLLRIWPTHKMQTCD